MNDIQIIKRETIPPITTIEEGGAVHLLGELRDFSWSEPLKKFMGNSSGFSASWVQLQHQEVLTPHTHPVLSMMVFYAGSGQMIGALTRPLAGDEVVVVPPGCLHGFIGGPQGLRALSIQFAGGLYSDPKNPQVVFSKQDASLSQLIAFSEQRASLFTTKPMFELLGLDALANGAKRRAFFGALGIWLDGIENLLVSRYATCNDPRYQSAFREHLMAFVGQSARRKPLSAGQRHTRDSALEAVANWFSYQMYVLDNAEKAAIVCLVVDKVNAILRKYLSPVLSAAQLEEAFGPQTLDADLRMASSVRLLERATPRMYTRLKGLVGEAWDMAEAMTDRIAVVTHGAKAA